MRIRWWLRAGFRTAAIAGAVAVGATCGSAAEQAGSPPLTLERTIALDGVGGRIDHMAVDLGRQRLLVAELGNGTLDAIDLATGKIAHRIAGLKSPQGVAYAAESDQIAVASAGDGTLRLFRGDDFAPAGVISLGDDADNVRIDPRNGHV